MERLRKERSIARSIFTKTKNKFAELVGKKDDLNLTEIKTSFELLTEKAGTLFNVDNRIQEQWLAQDELSEEDIVKDSEETDVYKEEFYKMKLKYDEIVPPKTPSESHYDSVSVNECRKQQIRRLPKLELSKFDGDSKNWLGFWSSFKKIHNDVNLDDDDKMAYLIQSMIIDSAAHNLVKSFPPCGENYDSAMEQLKERYGRDELLIEIYVRELLSLVLQQAKESDTLPLTSLYDKLKTQLRALESLGVTSDKYALMLYPLVESALPEEILRVWERQRGSGKGTDDLSKLLDFVKAEVESEERIKLARKSLNIKDANVKEAKVPTAACLVAGNSEQDTSSKGTTSKKAAAKCIWCNSPNRYHKRNNCQKMHDMTPKERIDLITKKKLCFVCLSETHSTENCYSVRRCINCHQKHDVVLCPELGKTNEESLDNSGIILTSKSNGTTLLQTLTVKIGNETIRAFIDSGAQRSYIRKDIATKLGLKPERDEILQHCLFGGVETKQETHQVYDLTVTSVDGKSTLKMTALSKEKICGYIPRIRNDDVIMKKLKDQKLTLTDVGESTPEVGLLIGADHAGRIATGIVLRITENLHAFQTKLGWTLLGRVARENNWIVASTDICDTDISKLWELEILGIEDPKTTLSKSRSQEEAIETFKENISINEAGRYEVALPWKTDRPELLDNKKLAEKRLESTTKRLKSLNELENYGKVFEEWLELGIVEVDPDLTSPGHYLSHHAVIKESSLTTRVRPVFDASARDANGNSINACLEKGQNLLELIPILLTRFRMHMIGVTSDIKKAFLQISVSEDDRKFLRFLWLSEKGEMIAYRHCRVVFGLTCSPFLLGATIIYHLEKYRSSEYADTARTLKESFYVDNCVMSAKSQEEAERFIQESKHIMEEGKFDLRGWITAPVNCKNTEKESMISVLGLTWDTEKDELQCNLSPLKAYKEKVTRRELLLICNRVFDPIGFTCPATLIPKLLLQRRTWCLNTGWDKTLPDDICKEFNTWMEEVHWLKECKIPRRLTSDPIEKGTNTFHTFSDASKNAYATCTFLRSETEKGVTVQLVMAKARVSPVKEISIPRLELIAALMSTRIYVQARDALRLENCKAYFWTDSSVAMTWITTDKEWNIFVRNRVKEIREQSKPEDWRHLKGTLNPADLPSRGCHGKKLAESKWWEGPAWLKDSEDKWPVTKNFSAEEELVNKELKKNIVLNNTDLDLENFTTCLNRLSKYSKIVRTVAWILRFHHNCKNVRNKMRGELTYQETIHAEKKILRVVQEESLKGKQRGMKDVETFKDEDGLLRVKTRLTLSEENENFKSPTLLSGKHPIVAKLVEQRHLQYLHAGVNILFSTLRNDYWILGGRRLAKKIISRCVTCKRFNAGNYKTPTAPLPKNRVKNTGVFQITGVDAAGPLILNTGDKSWMILFTCAVYRAIHIELVMSMSTECFMMALRRFIARRGRIQVMYSDNGTNFVGTENLLACVEWKAIQEYSTIRKIKWVFNPPAAPWWGGWWERIIRMIKELLRRNLGRASLTFVELETILCDIEGVINSRPLTYVAEDDTFRPLTPETFLHPLQGTEVSDLDEIDKDLNARQKHLQSLRSDLRQRFRNEYLSLLVSRAKESNRPIRVGDVVIIETDAKRMHWPLGIVEEIHMGKDGQYRVAKVKTTDGYRTRPVQRLYPLEAATDEARQDAEIEEVVPENPPPDPKQDGGASEDIQAPPRTTRCGRLLKVPRRLDL